MATRTQDAARILILSRNGENADPLAFLLNIAGYEVLAVGDSAAATDAVATFHPTVCLTWNADFEENLRKQLPLGTVVFVGSGPSTSGLQLQLTGEENPFQIAERIEDYLHELAIAV